MSHQSFLGMNEPTQVDLNWYSFPERKTHGKQARNGSSLSRYSLSMPFKTIIDKSKPTGWCATPSFFCAFLPIDKNRRHAV